MSFQRESGTAVAARGRTRSSISLRLESDAIFGWTHLVGGTVGAFQLLWDLLHTDSVPYRCLQRRMECWVYIRRSSVAGVCFDSSGVYHPLYWCTPRRLVFGRLSSHLVRVFGVLLARRVVDCTQHHPTPVGGTIQSIGFDMGSYHPMATRDRHGEECRQCVWGQTTSPHLTIVSH